MERNSNGKRPPALNWDNAVSLITRIFPLEDVSHTTFKELLCHEDRLYYFEGQHEGQLTRKQFVLRLSNTKFGHDVVSGHNAVMLHLRARGIHCCEPIVTKLGHHLETLSEADLLQKSGGRDVSYIVRVLTYIPGELMDEVDKCFLTSQLYYDVGYFVGQMDMALQDFNHDAVASSAPQCWDLQHFTRLKKYFPHVESEQKRKKVCTIMAAYEAHILPKLPFMKKGVIHGDVHGQNIILHKVGEKYEMVGVIDFGDCVQTCNLTELATMLAHGMMGKENPVKSVAPMLRGYLDAFPLSREELNCLYYAVLVRLSAIAVQVEHLSSLKPWSMYISDIPLAYGAIDLLLTLSKEEVEKAWKFELM